MYELGKKFRIESDNRNYIRRWDERLCIKIKPLSTFKNIKNFLKVFKIVESTLSIELIETAT